MQSAYSIDVKLLSIFQCASERIQQFSGQDNFGVAKLLKIIMICCFIIREVLAFIQGIDVTECVVIACSITVIFKMTHMQRKAEDALKNNIELMNPAIVEYAMTRIILQFVAMGGLGFLVTHLYNVLNFKSGIIITANEVKELFWDIFAILLFFVAYFNSCTPKPSDIIKRKIFNPKSTAFKLKSEVS